ncbi:MAG TPA: hypothetical protein VJW55_16315, partial [Candidatus Angelobacter sp.]|nr:hypothetical protein [Candidatus Angelobacter sp.]
IGPTLDHAKYLRYIPRRNISLFVEQEKLLITVGLAEDIHATVQCWLARPYSVTKCFLTFLSKSCTKYRTRFSAGSVLWPSKHGGFTAHDWPSLAASPIASFQAAQFREYEQYGVKIKTERGLVLEQNGDCGHVWIKFYSLKGFAFDFAKAQKP